MAQVEKSKTVRSGEYSSHSEVRMKSDTLASTTPAFLFSCDEQARRLKNPVSTFAVVGVLWQYMVLQKIFFVWRVDGTLIMGHTVCTDH